MKKFIATIIFCLIIFCASICSAMKISVLDVGQGDSILIESDTQNILVDTGPPESREKLMTAISHLPKIDKLIITHPHADHVGNAFYLIENKPVGMAYDNGEISASSYYLNYLAGLSMENIERVTLKAGDVLNIDGATLTFLNPIATYDVNNNSLVFRLAYGNFSMLFTGDIGFMAEAEILASGANVSSKVLKAAHHGAKNSASYNFVQAVNPEAVIISAGKNNRFKHPSKEAVSIYRRFTNKIYCTAFNGCVTIRTDGQNFQVTPESGSDWLENFELTKEIISVQKI